MKYRSPVGLCSHCGMTVNSRFSEGEYVAWTHNCPGDGMKIDNLGGQQFYMYNKHTYNDEQIELPLRGYKIGVRSS